MTETKASIIIPVLNEATNLSVLVPILEALVITPNKILVVYDFKEDTSISIAEELQKKYGNIELVHNTLGRGVINAIKAGVAASKTEYVVTMAADDIGIPLGVDDIIALLDEGCTLVNATRYANGGKNIGGSFMSTILSTTANKILHIFSRSQLTDQTFGVKGFTKTLFESVHLESKPVGWAWSFEFAIKGQIAGAKLGEVPLISLNRLYAGSSSFNVLPWVKEYLKWFYWGFFRRKPHQSVKVKIPAKLQK